YFALMGNKRIIDQLCLTNPDVYDLTVKTLKEEMTKQPEKKLWSVSQGDNFSYCQCDACAKIIADEASAAGPIIHFVNKVAAQFPDKIISTLAYQYSRKAPKHIKPANNVQIMLCTIELNRSKAIENDSLSVSFLKDITDWGKISQNIYLWDYTVNFSHHITPFPNLHTLQKNIQFFTKKLCRLPLQYSMMEIGKTDMFGARGFYNEYQGKFILKPAMKKMVENFYMVCKQNKVKNVNEAGLTPLAYYETTKRFINVQVEGNFAFRKMASAFPMPSNKYSNADLTILTNGVQGANDFKAHWLGWEAQDFEIVLDLQKSKQYQSIQISTLYDPKSWIMHPKSVSCLVSEDGVSYRMIETKTIEGNQRKENVTQEFKFEKNIGSFRFVKFEVTGTKKLFNWHQSAGGGSWVFVDEIIVR
ncbi:MAG: DUF4838 domain-containing protein, partial [Sediminibacterium sp.]|nr:DUF4838 domain-containing protein [Sediminibacterium sp.]